MGYMDDQLFVVIYLILVGNYGYTTEGNASYFTWIYLYAIALLYPPLSDDESILTET